MDTSREVFLVLLLVNIISWDLLDNTKTYKNVPSWIVTSDKYLLAFGSPGKFGQPSSWKGRLSNDIILFTAINFELVQISYLWYTSDFLLITLVGVTIYDVGTDPGKHLNQEATILLTTNTTKDNLQTLPHQEIELNSLSILVFPPI